MQHKDSYLVVGGSGLLGRHIVVQLRDRGDSVAVLDLVQRYDDTPFYSGDISEEGVVLSVLIKVRGATKSRFTKFLHHLQPVWCHMRDTYRVTPCYDCTTGAAS